MADVIVRSVLTKMGKSVRRPGLATDYAAGVNHNIFNIAGGLIRVYAFFGYVTVAATGAGAVPLLAITPTAGPGVTPLCTVAVGAAHAIGTLMAWSGVVAGVLTPNAAGIGDATTATMGFANGGMMTLPPGIIRVTNAVADATLVIDWYIGYYPLGDAVVTIL